MRYSYMYMHIYRFINIYLYKEKINNAKKTNNPPGSKSDPLLQLLQSRPYPNTLHYMFKIYQIPNNALKTYIQNVSAVISVKNWTICYTNASIYKRWLVPKLKFIIQRLDIKQFHSFQQVLTLARFLKQLLNEYLLEAYGVEVGVDFFYEATSTVGKRNLNNFLINLLTVSIKGQFHNITIICLKI